jgi:hypothetical protein
MIAMMMLMNGMNKVNTIHADMFAPCQRLTYVAKAIQATGIATNSRRMAHAPADDGSPLSAARTIMTKDATLTTRRIGCTVQNVERRIRPLK